MVTKNKIMIIDDAIDIKELLVSLFEGEGYDVVSAENGEDALTHLRSTDHLPTVILLDLTMPVMDGIRFRHEQAKDARIKHIPVVLMSAAGDMATVARDLRVNASLRKPFIDIDAILETVKNLL